ncbi:MAG: DNA adenine methylase [Pirellulales bacterium]
MIAKQRTRQSAAPLKWHGGKSYLAERIVRMMPKHLHYVEPYFGGGAVFFRKPGHLIQGHSEVINDLYGELVTFWRVLQSRELFSEFQRRVALTPFAKPLWEEAGRNVSSEPIDRAWAFFVRYRQSRQGLGRDFATMSRNRTRRGMNEQVSSWLSAIEGLPEAHERLSRVVIYDEPALDVIRREDGLQTFHYCDPPYLSAIRVVKDTYSREMSDADHRELLTTLGGIQGKFQLSGYRSELYDEAAARFGWNRTDIAIDNKASAQKNKPTKVECLWANF